MGYAVFAIAFLLSLISGAVSFAIVPYIRITRLNGEKSNDDDNKCDTQTAVTSPKLFSPISKKAWLVIIASSAVCAVSSFGVYRAYADVLFIVRCVGADVLLLSAAIIDKETCIIPNFVILIFVGFGIVLLGIELFTSRDTVLYSLISGSAGLFFSIAFFYVLSRITKGGIGMGDIKLIASMGWVFGLTMALFATLFGLLTCAVVSLIFIFAGKKKKTDKLPFGPFIFLGYILSLMLYSI